MTDSEDDAPQLSAAAFTALLEFYNQDTSKTAPFSDHIQENWVNIPHFDPKMTCKFIATQSILV